MAGKNTARREAGKGDHELPKLMRGVEASASRRAVHGPDSVPTRPSDRDALCALLKLREPSDQALFRSAVHEIESQRRDRDDERSE